MENILYDGTFRRRFVKQESGKSGAYAGFGEVVDIRVKTEGLSPIRQGQVETATRAYMTLISEILEDEEQPSDGDDDTDPEETVKTIALKAFLDSLKGVPGITVKVAGFGEAGGKPSANPRESIK